MLLRLKELFPHRRDLELKVVIKGALESYNTGQQLSICSKILLLCFPIACIFKNQFPAYVSSEPLNIFYFLQIFRTL